MTQIKIRTVNIKNNMPTVTEARARLKNELTSAKSGGVIALKIVHGYGSSGIGGVLKDAVRKSLLYARKGGLIKAYVYGEKWDIFDPIAQEILSACPDLKSDPDLQKFNEGVTIVLM